MLVQKLSDSLRHCAVRYPADAQEQKALKRLPVCIHLKMRGEEKKEKEEEEEEEEKQ